MDVDHFKKVNDTYGHDTGDRVLRMVARTLGASLRSVDALGRWGGEEFVAVVSNATGEQLRVAAERCRALVAQSALEVGQHQVRVTISIGAALARAEDTTESLLERVDRSMYRAKVGGRNRVESEEALGES